MHKVSQLKCIGVWGWVVCVVGERVNNKREEETTAKTTPPPTGSNTTAAGPSPFLPTESAPQNKRHTVRNALRERGREREGQARPRNDPSGDSAVGCFPPRSHLGAAAGRPVSAVNAALAGPMSDRVVKPTAPRPTPPT